MKKLFIFILLSLWMFYGPLAGQQIIRMEYFMDADPGFGNGISVPVETLSDQTVSFTALLDGLDPGLHFLYLRAQDDNGHWSQTLQRMILVRRLPEGSHADLTRVEFFWDNDPGFGLGIPFSTSTTPFIDIDSLLDIAMLQPGFHHLYVRARDENGLWSSTIKKVLWINPTEQMIGPALSHLEYFLDEDPGFGEATSADLPAEPLGGVTMVLPLDTLSPGFHQLYVRPLDENGCWGNTFSQPFISIYLSFYENAHIAYAEYFFDEDPGQGEGTPLSVPEGSNIEIALNIPLDDLLPGFHHLLVRAKDVNGFWSCVYKHIFWLEKTSDAPGITQMEYFFDTDPGIGHATKISGDLLPGAVFAVDLPLDTLSRGFHTIYVRTRDETGSWGLTHFQPFINIHAPADSIRIVRMEYFVDEDPGFGNGFPVSLIYPGADVRKHFVAELNDLEAGNHLFFLRAIDEQSVWSMVYTEEFEFVMTDPCDPPADLEATDIEETSAMAHWVSDDAPWDLLYGTLDFEATELGVLVHALDANQHLMENLLPGSFSEFYVRSTCSDGQVSPWAGPAQFHTLPLPTYQLTLAVDPAEGGTVTGEGNYTQGETVNITATPNENYIFLHWSGSTTYVDNPEAASAMVTMPGEAVSLTAHFQLVTGLEYLAENGFKVFPNPAAEKLYLQFYKPDSKKVLLVISNLQGQVVEEMELSEKGYVQLTLDVSHLETGVYMLHIRGEHQFPVKKIIVAR